MSWSTPAPGSGCRGARHERTATFSRPARPAGPWKFGSPCQCRGPRRSPGRPQCANGARSSTSRCATSGSSSARGSSCSSCPRDRRADRRPERSAGLRRAPRGSPPAPTTGSARPRSDRTSSPSSSTACRPRSSSGLLGGGLAALVGISIGFVAGYRGGIVDEILNMITNVVLVIPTLAVLRRHRCLPQGARGGRGGRLHRADLLAVGRAGVRAQTFSLRSREFVDLARLSGLSELEDHLPGDRPEHGLLPVHDLHPALRRGDPDRRDPRLHRPRPDRTAISLGTDDEQRRALERSAAAGSGGGSSRPGLRSRPSSGRCTS